MIDFSAQERYILPQAPKQPRRGDAAEEASRRACFLDIQRVRTCTDLNALIQRGAVLLERPGIPPLLIDPSQPTASR